MAKDADIVAEIAGQVRTRRHMRWFQAVAPEHVATLDVIAAAYKAGKFGAKKKPAADAIVAVLQARGIATVGYNGVLQWLESL